ncbi:hypothetical protein [Alkalimonas amylolytica]|uniref:Uncharacterized protein n=1 Tax=Alkalimonas amylolytica TaxID=152573 RepID=A0A1H3XTB0_ALKAM|nr:hypothetical protein [Alkalimonas amylolytica]SEA02553.1 hypothetical protein SAMN04488051_101383 [Alkalimonas amylolytica]
MRRPLIQTLITAAVLYCHFSSYASGKDAPPIQAASLPYTQTSLLQLIAHPERFYNTNIQVSAFYYFDRLTISLDSSLRDEFRVNLMIDDYELRGSQCNEQWIVLEGHLLPVFDQERRYTYGRVIPDRLTIRESGVVCWQRTEPYQYPLVSN